MDWLTPADADELTARVREHRGDGGRLHPTGAAGPPADLGGDAGGADPDRVSAETRDADARGAVLSTAALSGILDFRPRDLTVAAGAGTRVVELVDRLAEEGYWLALGGPALRLSVGGLVAAAPAGPFDESYGDLRRQLLACELVTWSGERARWGRGVMKNVAGYGMTRAVVGAFERPGVVLRATFRLWPAPAEDRTFGLRPAEGTGGDADDATGGHGALLALAGRAAAGDLDGSVRPDALVWRRVGPAAVVSGGVAPPRRAHLEARFVGSQESVVLRRDRLATWAGGHGAEVVEPSDPAPAPPRRPGRSVVTARPGRSRFAAAGRRLVDTLGDDLVRAEGYPLAGVLRFTYGRGGSGADDGGALARLAAAAEEIPLRVERGSSTELETAADRRPEGARRLEERVVEALGGRPRHWLSGYL